MEAAYIPMPVATVKEAEELPSLTYRLDLTRGRIIGMVDKLEAVNQAMRKALKTPRFKCLIYDGKYGSEGEAAVVSDASQEYKETVLEGFVRDTFRPDTRILSVYDFKCEFKEDGAHVFFRADTIFGKTEVGEVL